METSVFEVISLDVWGNEEDGFEVNAAYRTGKFIEMSLVQYEDDDFIIKSLIEMEFLTDEALDKVSIEGDGKCLTVQDDRTFKPLYNLEMI